MSSVTADPRLDAPHLPPADDVQAVLAVALRRRAFPAGPDPLPAWELWAPSHFGLDRVSRFHRAGEDERRRILAGCARALLEEAYFIEKAGLGFTAKMVLLSETAEERVLYSLFAADEAVHFHAIASCLAGPVDRPADGPFLRLVAEAIEHGTRPSLAYLIQVVLEGWGIVHYQSLARGCRGERLRRALAAIARDEALHHRSGVLLAGRGTSTDGDRTFLVEALVRLLEMVRAGPQAVVSCLAEVTGPLGRAERVEVFRELDAGGHTRQRLDLLRSLMRTVPADPLVGILDGYGLFTPLDPQACAIRAAEA